MDADEHDLIQRALRGDREAFEGVIRAYGRRVHGLAYGICQDTAEAEDITQETFFKAWRNRWRLRDPAKFPAWLFSVTRHHALDILRRRRTAPLPDEAPDDLDDTQPRPGSGLESAELHFDIHAALAGLPERHRTALTLRYLEDMDARAIEQTMGLSNGALRGVLGRALAAMRKNLQSATASKS